jgi:hypothetical protein
MDEGGLTEPECWELLAHADIGRLGVVPGRYPLIFPSTMRWTATASPSAQRPVRSSPQRSTRGCRSRWITSIPGDTRAGASWCSAPSRRPTKTTRALFVVWNGWELTRSRPGQAGLGTGGSRGVSAAVEPLAPGVARRDRQRQKHLNDRQGDLQQVVARTTSGADLL